MSSSLLMFTVCLYVCLYVFLCVCLGVHKCIMLMCFVMARSRLWESLHFSNCLFLYVQAFAIGLCTSVCEGMFVCVCVCVSVCVCVCVCVCACEWFEWAMSASHHPRGANIMTDLSSSLCVWQMIWFQYQPADRFHLEIRWLCRSCRKDCLKKEHGLCKQLSMTNFYVYS